MTSRDRPVSHAASQAASAGETAATVHTEALLEQLVTEHYDRLLGLARLICRDASDAADAVQTGLEQGWRNRSSLRSGAAGRAWLDRIVVREAIRVSRSRRSWLARLLHPDAQAAWIEPADTRASNGLDRAALRAAFAELSADQRAVVALHLHAGYSVAETAVIVGAPEETVRSRLRLARQRLRRQLEEVER
jgi:RNA polymerase sigma-70 factor (ECF subfamily)